MKETGNACILMVEDEKSVLRINARILQRRGYEVLTAASCAQAYELLAARTPDLLILDVMLPDGSGLEICRRFRQSGDQPVILLTGKTALEDKIRGLDRGADYYLTKPYDPDELLAIADRLLQRHWKQCRKQQELQQLMVITKGPLVLDLSRARATVDGEDAGLTVKEFALLLALVQQEGQELSPHTLYEAVWGTTSAEDTRTVRTHIKNLRRKIQAENSPHYDIVCAYGKGYTFTSFR